MNELQEAGDRKEAGYRKRGRPLGPSADRDARFLADIEAGYTRTQACERAQIQKQSLEARMSRNPEWKARVVAAEAIGKPKRALLKTESFPDFLEFRERFFVYQDHRSRRFVRAQTNWYQRDSYKRLREENRLIVIMPPGHLKTTTYCIEYVTWLIMRDRNTRALVIKKSQPEAKKDVAAVEERLTCDYYHTMASMLEDQGDEPIECPICLYFPDKPFKPEGKYSGDKWGAEGFRVQGVTSGEKDDTMQAKGVGSQVLGIRADIIIMDDVQSDIEARTSGAATADKAMWINASILGRVTMSQKVVYLGNYYASQDLAHKVIADHPDFALFEYPAILEANPISGVPYKVPKPLCPEFWSYRELLQKRKEVGEHVWFYTWMQEAGSFEDQTFRREALEAARDDTLQLGMVPAGVSDLVLGVDPAAAVSGFCAMVLWGLNRKTKQRYLIDVFNRSGMRNWDNVVDQIVYYCQTYPVRKVIIERRNVQGTIVDNPRYSRAITSTGAQYAEYKTVTGTGAQGISSNFDITTVGKLFDAGLVTLPYGGDEAQREKVESYISQLAQWHTDGEGRSIKHLVRDMVMATLFAESETFKIANRVDRAPPPPPKARTWVAKSFGRFKQAS